MGPDLATALGTVLGITFVFTPNEFASIPAKLADGTIDVGMSAMPDTRDREKKMDFVNYFSAGTSIVVPRAIAGASRT